MPPHPNADGTTHVDVAIIGAGLYGLACARVLLKLEPNCTLRIFDKYDSVGGVWSKSRLYPTLNVQADVGLFNYPSTPMSPAGKSENNLVTGDMVNCYLEKFATDNDLKRHITFNSWVSSVRRNPAGGWTLTVNDEPVNAAKVVCAAGVTTEMSEPQFRIADNSIPVIHVADMGKNVENFKKQHNEHFVLLGAAKSAYDAAYLLTSMGKRVTWVIRDNGSGPMPLVPTKILNMSTMSFTNSRLMAYLSPSIIATDTWLGSFFHRTILGRFLTRTFWAYLTRQFERSANFGDSSADPVQGLKPDVTENSCFWSENSLGLVTNENFWSILRESSIRIVRDQIASTDDTGVTLQNTGEHIDADYVIYATGWGDHFAFFSPELKDELGFPPYGAPVPLEQTKDFKSGLPVSPDPWRPYDKAADHVVVKKLPLLAAKPHKLDQRQRKAEKKIIRRPWRLYNRVVPLSIAAAGHRSLVALGQIHTSQTPIVAEIQSLWAAAYLLGDIDLPAEEDMIKEIAEWNAWSRRRYGATGERYPYSVFDWIPYLDRLLKDLGIKSPRNSNVVSDLFKTYSPHMYRHVISEYMALRNRQSRASS